MDKATHQRFLEYRERHAYFAATTPLLSRDAFVAADRDQRELEAKGDARDDEEEARWTELSKLLFRD